jgi:hypothetical protein
VLLGVLRGDSARAHLDWIHQNRLYYTRMTPTQLLQYRVQWVAFYEPAAIREPGAVTQCAPVVGIEVRNSPPAGANRGGVVPGGGGDVSGFLGLADVSGEPVPSLSPEAIPAGNPFQLQAPLPVPGIAAPTRTSRPGGP